MTANGTFFERAFNGMPPARLIDEDPDLFAGLPAGARAEAKRQVLARTFRRHLGPWNAGDEVTDPRACLGLLVLDGLILRSVKVSRTHRSEIVGPGDILRPWQDGDELSSVPVSSRWDVVVPARIAVLDARTLAFASRWPAVMLAIVERTMRRSQWLALQLAIADVRRVDERLLLFLWHLADRWGKVGPDGVHVPLPVTHDVLAQLVCAQRPTVTSALKRLTEAGRIRRRRDRTWLLTPRTSPSRVLSMAR